MQRLLGLGVVVVGIIVLVYGLDASNSVGSSVSRLFAGAAENKTIRLVVGGALCLIAGLGAALSSWRRTRNS